MAPAAVSAFILKTLFFLSNPKGAITGTFFSFTISSIVDWFISLGVPK